MQSPKSPQPAPPGKPPAKPAPAPVPHSGEGADSAFDAMIQQRVPAPRPPRDNGKK